MSSILRKLAFGVRDTVSRQRNRLAEAQLAGLELEQGLRAIGVHQVTDARERGQLSEILLVALQRDVSCGAHSTNFMKPVPTGLRPKSAPEVCAAVGDTFPRNAWLAPSIR